MTNANILSQRYATKELNEIFSEEGKTISERELWIAVMKAQKDLGLEIPGHVISNYENAKKNVDLKLIEEIERRTKHDVKAKIEAFVKTSGSQEHIHKGMTSKDLTDNVEQMQIQKACLLIFKKYLAVLKKMVDKSEEYSNIFLSARTHHQPAQITLLGRRMSMWTEELFLALRKFETFIENYPLRGIKGPIGTQFDMLTLLGSKEKVIELEKKIATHLGFRSVLDSPGQVYFRSLDYELIQNLSLLACACENFGKGIRLMAGFELVTEGFKEGQVGSSAMPHKMNTRSSERICGFSNLLKMYTDGSSRIAGDQWEEGDVSDSVVRRVIIPDAFYASDGVCETTLTVLSQMGPYPIMLNKEIERYLPFLATTEILMHAVKKGIGREEAHEIIKKIAVSAALEMRSGGQQEIVKNLSENPRFIQAGISRQEIQNILEEKKHFIGNAKDQIESIRRNCQVFFDNYPDALNYQQGDIL